MPYVLSCALAFNMAAREHFRFAKSEILSGRSSLSILVIACAANALNATVLGIPASDVPRTFVWFVAKGVTYTMCVALSNWLLFEGRLQNPRPGPLVGRLIELIDAQLLLIAELPKGFQDHPVRMLFVRFRPHILN